MRHHPIALVLLLALTATNLPAQPPAETDDLAARLERLVRPLLDGRVVAGMAVGIRQDEKVDRFAFGKLPAGADSVFEVGSITKVFTGYLLADMVRDGTVRLDQPVRELFPAGTVVPKHGEREITLLDLATHRSGLPRMPTNFFPKNRKDPYADYDEKRLLAYLATAKLTTPPGKRKLYSNLGMGLLGQALARRSGTTYEQLLATRILRPLGLSNTAITLDEKMKKRLAPGHDADLRRVSNWDLNVMAGAGAIRSTVGDLLVFLAAHFATKDGVPDFRLAWSKGGVKGSVWHNGQTGGYHGAAIVVPERKLAVVVLADTASRRIDDLAGRILRLMMGHEVQPPKVLRPVEVDAKRLEGYVGRYRHPSGPVFTVTRDDSGLFVRMPNRPRRRLYALNETTFFLRVAPMRMVFETDDAGRATGVVLHQKGKKVRAPRTR